MFPRQPFPVAPFPLPTLYIRHGYSQANDGKAARREVFTPAVELTETGHQQSREVAEWLPEYCRQRGWKKLALCITPYVRGQQTAQHSLESLSAAGIDFLVYDMDLMREHYNGVYDREEQVAHDDYKTLHANARNSGLMQYFIPFGGESQTAAYERSLLFHRMCVDALQSGAWQGVDALVLFGHAMIGRIYTMARMGYPWSWFYEGANPPNCSARLIENGREEIIFTPKLETHTRIR